MDSDSTDPRDMAEGIMDPEDEEEEEEKREGIEEKEGSEEGRGEEEGGEEEGEMLGDGMGLMMLRASLRFLALFSMTLEEDWSC